MKKRIRFLLAVALILAIMLPAIPALPVLADDGDTFNANSTDDVLYISTPNDYINFFKAAFVNEPKNDFKGKTIIMMKDIDLNDTTTEGWYAKEKLTKLSGNNGSWKWFNGTFDGGNHTLKGAIVDGLYRTNDAPIGIFPYAVNATIKNLVVDGFYICSPNTSVNASYGAGGIGGLIGHAKESITIDNVTMRNGVVTCVENGKGAIGAIIGNYEPGVAEQTLEITNCTVENTVELLAGKNAAIAYMGGIVGMTEAANGSVHLKIYVDLTGSCIQPKRASGSNEMLNPWGYGRNGHGTYQHVFNIKNEATGYTTGGNKWLGTNVVYTSTLNEYMLASGCYSATAAPVVRLAGTQTRAADNAVRFVGMLKIPESLEDVSLLGFEVTVGNVTKGAGDIKCTKVYTSVLENGVQKNAPDGYYYFTFALTGVNAGTAFTVRACATVGEKVCTTTAATYTYTPAE